MAMGDSKGLLDEVRRFIDGLSDQLPALFSRTAARVRVHKRVPFRGEDLPLRLVDDPAARRCELIHGPDGLTLRRSAARLAPQAVLRRWYAQRAKEIFAQRAAFWAPRLGVRYEKLSIRDQRTVWGSCAKGGRLSFNWRVVMAPPEVLDYLVIHELAHLLEMNHSKRFWAHVGLHCPEWKERRLWLRDNSRRLKSVVRRES